MCNLICVRKDNRNNSFLRSTKDFETFIWALFKINQTCVVNCKWFCVPQRLGEWVAVQSVSAWPEKRGEIKRMMEIAAKDIERLGGTAELVDIGKQKVGVLVVLGQLTLHVTLFRDYNILWRKQNNPVLQCTACAICD